MPRFPITLPMLVVAPIISLAFAQDTDERPTVARPASLIRNGDFSHELSEGDFAPGSWATIRTAVMAAPLDPPVAGHHRLARLGSSPMPGSVLWHTCFVPPPCTRLRGEPLLRACHEHVTDHATWMRGHVHVWDVVDEAVTNTEAWDDIGWDTLAEW